MFVCLFSNVLGNDPLLKGVQGGWESERSNTGVAQRGLSLT